jgi:transcription elongation factor Elf1
MRKLRRRGGNGPVSHRQNDVSLGLGGSMSCPKCSHETKVIGTEKNKRILYCERCELVIKEKKLEDKLEMS